MSSFIESDSEELSLIDKKLNLAINRVIQHPENLNEKENDNFNTIKIYVEKFVAFLSKSDIIEDKEQKELLDEILNSVKELNSKHSFLNSVAIKLVADLAFPFLYSFLKNKGINFGGV